jgi:hypothetical protein
MKSEPGPPMTLGAAAARRRPPDRVVSGLPPSGRATPVEDAWRYGAGMSLLEWRERLVCSQCGGRQVDMVVSGTERR